MRRNNRGMAFVTVLIATLFIGLLATSLCFMAYNNYLTKTTRWSAENNFYYNEFALNELTTAMRQQADTVSYNLKAEFDLNNVDPDAVGPDVVTEFYKELAHCTGVVGTDGLSTDDGDPAKNFTGRWDPDAMNDLLKTMGITNSNFDATVEADISVEVLTIDPAEPRGEPTYIRKKKDIYFKNVRMQVTDNKTGYTTTITTDIHFPTKPKSAKIPVNEFCLMSDSPVNWECGGIVHVGGNIFTIDDPNPTDHDGDGNVDHLGNALTLSNSTQLTLGGKKSLFVGNVVVKENSRLILNNEVTITGELIIEDGSSVTCMSKDVMIGKISLASEANIDGEAYVVDEELDARATAQFDGDQEHNDLGAGLSNGIANDVYFITSFNTSDNSYTTYSYEKSASNASSIDAMNDVKNSDGGGTHMQYGTDCQVFFRIGSNDVTDLHDTLAFFPENGQKIRGDYTNTTIISTAGSALSSDDPTMIPYMTRMSDADYYAVLNTLISVDDVNSIKPTLGDDSGINLNATVGVDGDIDTFDDILYKMGLSPTDADYDEDIINQYFVDEMNTLGKETRYFVYDKTNNKQLIPWKYFIRDDADELIGTAFSSIRDGGADGGNYSIVYENWVKE